MTAPTTSSPAPPARLVSATPVEIVPPTERRSAALFRLAAMLALLATLALWIDLPVSAWFHAIDQHGPGDLRKGLDLFEAFAHGLGVAVILITVAVLDRRRRREVWRLGCCAYGAGVVNLLVKCSLARVRPQVFWASEMPERIGETFLGPTFWLSSEQLVGRSIQSFPSGHSAVAAGLACGLAWLYPQGKYLFAALAALAMLQRVECGAHFPSDTLAGATVGTLVAAVCLSIRPRRVAGIA